MKEGIEACMEEALQTALREGCMLQKHVWRTLRCGLLFANELATTELHARCVIICSAWVSSAHHLLKGPRMTDRQHAPWQRAV